MTDYYLKSTTYDALAGMLTQVNGTFHVRFTNILGPRTGRAATEEMTLEDGRAIPASDAVGDPNMYYACVRTDEELTLPDNVSLCDTETGVAVLGVWL